MRGSLVVEPGVGLKRIAAAVDAYDNVVQVPLRGSPLLEHDRPFEAGRRQPAEDDTDASSRRGGTGRDGGEQDSGVAGGTELASRRAHGP